MLRKSVLNSWSCRIAGFLLGMACTLSAWAGPTSISVGNASVTVPGPIGATLNFPITRTGDLSYDAYLNYQTTNGTAIAGKDYVPQAGALKIPAGVSNINLPVTVGGKAESLSAKEFGLGLSGGSTTAPIPSFINQGFAVGGDVITSLAVADLNGDGMPDVITIDQSSKMYVQINTSTPGSPTLNLAAPQEFDVSYTGFGGPAEVVAADINGDGKPDLIVANDGGTGVISVFINTTTPGSSTVTFAPVQNIGTGGAFGIAVADINGDGLPDIVAADIAETGNLFVLINTTVNGSTTASFSQQQTFVAGNFPYGIVITDLNGDGKPDIAVPNVFDNTISVLVNTTVTGSTTAAFASQQVISVGNNPQAIAAGDLNGDGLPDLAIADGGDNNVNILINTTIPNSLIVSFTPPQVFQINSNSSNSVSIADINGDGVPDVVVVDADGGRDVVVLDNNTITGSQSVTFASEMDFYYGIGLTAYSFWGVVADVNGDGRQDIVLADVGADDPALTDLQILVNTTSPTNFAPQQTFATGNYPYAVATGDLNGDGKPDMVTTNDPDGTVSVLLNTTPTGASTSSYAAQSVFSVGSYPESVTIADVNGDGLPDIITANSSDDTISILLNTTPPGASTPSFAVQQVIPVGMDPESVVALDVNGDGRLDLAVANYQDGTITVLLNFTVAGSATVDFSNQQTFVTSANPFQLAVADVNGDGLPDLVAANYGNSNITVLLNTTTQGSASPSFADPEYFDAGELSDPIAITAADLNGDGLPDIAIADQGGNRVQVLMNTTTLGASTASFGALQSFAVGNTPMSVIAVDLNGDSKPDLVATNYSDNSVSVLLNTTISGSATASFSTQLIMNVGNGPQFVGTTDVNGDGKPDIITTNNSGNTVSVLLNSFSTIPVIPSGITGTIQYNVVPPVITITGPTTSTVTSQSQALTGNVNEAGSFFINGVYVQLNSDRTFSYPLNPGTNVYTLIATDLNGNSTIQTRTFTVQLSTTLAPPAGTGVQFQAGNPGSVTLVGQPGTATAGETVYVTDVATGQTVSGTVNSDGSFSIPVPGGNTDNFTIVLTDGGSNQSPTVYLHSNDPALSLAVTSPSNSASITGNSVNVTGTYTGPLDMGITVNGQPAVLIDGGFYLNAVSLTAGSNTLTVTATTLGGLTTTQTLTVSSSGTSPLTFTTAALNFGTTSEYVGIGSLSVDFSCQYSGSAPLLSLQLSFDGGSDYSTYSAGDFFPPDQDNVSMSFAGTTYTAPGVHFATLIATDVNGVQYQAVIYVIVQDPAQMDALFGSVWGDLTSSLTAQNKPAAMNILDSTAQQSYSPVFDALMPTMPSIVSSFSPLMESTLNSSTAEYAVGRSQNGQDNLYFVYFVMDNNGVWRLESM